MALTPVPALPDSERLTTYQITANSTGPFAVGFDIYGEGSSPTPWFDVFVNGEKYGVLKFSVSSPSGSLASLVRPITDATITFTQEVEASVGSPATIQIVGNRRPSRVTQFGDAVTPRTLNRTLNDIYATLREQYDSRERNVTVPPGETGIVLPALAARVGLATWDDNGNLTGTDGKPVIAATGEAGFTLPARTALEGKLIGVSGGALVAVDPPSGNGAENVTATGATTARSLADHFGDLLMSPKNYGAVGDGVADDTVALNAMIAAARATLNSPLKIYQRGAIDLGNRTYRCNGSIDLTGFTSGYGVSFGNGKIVSHAAGKIALDCTGSTRLRLRDLTVIGDSVDIPKAGVVLARLSTGAVAGQHRPDNLEVRGTFSAYGILAHASEVGYWENVQVWNDFIGDNTYGVAFIGDDTGLTTVDSEFVTSGHGAFSNILVATKRMEVRRFKTTGITVTAISKTNPAVVTFAGAAPSNGAVLVWTSGGDMTELTNQVTTVANLNVGAGTFELSGVDATGYTTYTGGALLHFKTGPCVLMNDLSAHLHESMYLVTYGSYPIVIRNSAGELRKLHIDGHVEGAAIQALIRFDNLNSELYIHDFRLRQHNLHTPNFVFAMTGSGETRLGKANIELLNFAKTPTQFFDFPTEYGFGPGSRLYIGEANGISNDELGVLRRLPDEVVTPDATSPVRRFNGGAPSPAHAQVTFRGGNLFAPLSSTNALAYNRPFLMRCGSSAGPGINLLEAAADGVIRMRSSGGVDFSDFGAHIRTASIFRPDTGDMILDLALKLVTATTNRVTCIGFGSTATTAALADTDHPCTLAADGTPTFNDADFAGMCFDDTLTTKTWRAVSRKASGAPQSVDTGIAASLNTLYLRIFIHKSGALSVFQQSAPSALGTRVALISGACTASALYAGVVSQKNNNAETGSRNLDVMTFDAKCGRTFS